MIRCPWCLKEASPENPCSRCGGNLLNPGEAGPGESPPPPAREMPRGFRRRVRVFRNPFFIVGSCFGTSGKVITATSVLFGGVKGLSWMVGLGSFLGVILMFVGPTIVGWGVRWSEKKIHLLRKGDAVVGRVESTGRMDGRSNYFWLNYSYEVAGQVFTRRDEHLDEWVGALEAGRPIHVVYRSSKPQESTPWPPLNIFRLRVVRGGIDEPG